MVKCADCGFLTYRDDESRRLVEATDVYRTKDADPFANSGAETPLPFCFMRVADFQSEMASRVSKTYPGSGLGIWVQTRRPKQSMVWEVLGEDRKCQSFTKWQIGYTPAEHREMLDRHWERKMMLWQATIQAIGLVIAALAIAAGGFFTLRAANVQQEPQVIVLPAETPVPVPSPTSPGSGR